MRKLIFALAMLVVGAFAFGTGTPANAATAGSVTTLADIVKPSNLGEKVHYRRRFCWRHPYHWRCRRRYHRRYYYRRHYYRPWWY